MAVILARPRGERRYGGSTSATTTAARISAPPASVAAVSSSPVTHASSAANTGSSSRIRAARDGLTTRWAHTMAKNASAVAKTPVNAAAAQAARGIASPPVTTETARHASPTVVTCTQVSRMAS